MASRDGRDPKVLQHYLVEAEWHVLLGKRLIAEQRRRLADMTRLGLDRTQAQELLRLLEEIHVMQLARRDRLRAELADHAEGPEGT